MWAFYKLPVFNPIGHLIMKDPIILQRNNTLSPLEASYWQDLLFHTTKIGTELEVAPPKGTKRSTFEAAVHADWGA